MKKINLNEKQLSNIIKRIIFEEEDTHPQFTKIYKQLEIDLEGDGPYVIKETPNQLIAEGVRHRWTITKQQKPVQK